MKIVEINSYNFASTGNIMLGIAECARNAGHEVYTFNPDGRSMRKNVPGNFAIGNRYERALSSKINYYTGNHGALHFWGTYNFLRELDRIQPDIIHMHNLHCDYINIGMLVSYINKHHVKAVWTLHDCWSFTGHCPYFDIVACDKWKVSCNKCPMYHDYPASKWDNSVSQYKKKKKWFTSIEDLTIVTPSRWLADLVKESYLNKYETKVIYNGLNMTIFKSTESNFREKYHLEDKFIILGVAFSWGERKGQDRFERLAAILDKRYQIVLVGINKENVSANNIICIPKTNNQVELAEIYTAADVLLNPTREDNFPTVNIEALACGTPVLSYGAGGSAEAFDAQSGMLVSGETVVAVLDKLYSDNFDKSACVERGKEFEQNLKYKEYIDLYLEVYKK